MLYIERPPAPALRSFVRSLWYAHIPSAPHTRERILPTGRAQIVLALSRDSLTHCSENGRDERLPPAIVAGQRSIYETIATADLVDLVGITFAPGALPTLLSDRADLFSNQTLGLDQIRCGLTDHLRSQLQEGSSPEHRLCILESCLVTGLFANSGHRALTLHPAVHFALEQFSRNSNHLSVAHVAQRTGWSQRRFSQLFREQIGFQPKVWLRLQRFGQAVRQLRTGGEVALAELAFDCGFYDQAHLANEFRSFSGLDLTTYKSKRHDLWPNHVPSET